MLLVMGLLLGGLIPAGAKALSSDDRLRIQCAREKMSILTMMVDVNKSAEEKNFQISGECTSDGKPRPIKTPDWLAEELARQENNKVVFMQGEGKTLSEADLWKQAFANIYFYLDEADKSLDPNQPIVLSQLSREFMRLRIQLMLSVDRLNKDFVRGKDFVVMKDSFGGRGRSMLATMEVINGEFFSTIESFSAPTSQRENKYRQSVLSVVMLSKLLFREFLTKEPIPVYPPDPKVYATTRADNATSTFLVLIGSVLAGFAVYLFLENRRASILKTLEDYRAKSLVWAEDFNRQFVTIDVKYIVMGTILVFGIMGLVFGMMTGGFLGVFIFLLVLFIGGFISVRMPMAVLDTLKKSRGKKVNAQLMDALILLSNSLRSGMDIVQGFELVSRNLRPPIADEFGLVVKNYQLGTPFEKALDGMTERVESRMLSYIIKAIIIQRQVGGNLTVIFARLVENIREESKLEEKLQAMTAQQKIQSIVVSIMPFVMMLVMFIFNPAQMIGFYTSPVGIFVFMFCVIWIGIGMKILKKMGEVRV